MPLTRAVAYTRVEGLEHLRTIDGPVVFASNHLSHLDVPVILAAMPGRWRARVAPAMLKEFFEAHFHPGEHTWRAVVHELAELLPCMLSTSTASLFPQREIGTRHTLHYMGDLVSDNWSILIFPEGVRGETGTIRSVPRRHRHDRFAARCARRSRSSRRGRAGAPSELENGLGPAGFAWRLARRCGCGAMIMRLSHDKWKSTVRCARSKRHDPLKLRR